VKGKILSKGRFAKFVSEAPFVIVACGDKKASPDWYTIDVALAVENMVLTAISEGLSSCCVGSFDEKEVKATVEVPENSEVLLLLAIGYSAEKLDLSSKVLHLMRLRKTLSELSVKKHLANT
jgi:nitroreductase